MPPWQSMGSLALLEDELVTEERTDRERILSLEVELANLRALLIEQRQADRQAMDQSYRQVLNQLTQLATTADRYAVVGTVDKIEARLVATETTVADVKEKQMPRSEIQARFDGIAARQETMGVGIQRLDQSLIRLSDEWTAEQGDRKLVTEQTDKKRNLIVATIASIAAVATVVVTVTLGQHKPKIEVVYPTTTTVTTHP